MRFFELFSGIGGFSLAAKNTNNEIVGACEIDRFARQVYCRHFPGVRIWNDATKLNPEELPDFDILTAGFPCQAFSIAGRRLGFEESRGTLFFEIARIAKQKRPRYLLLENVVGLLSHDNGRTFAEILAALDEIGYDAEWQVLNSKYFVPQNRERIFIIGHLRTEPTKQVFPLGEINQRNNGSRQEPQEQGKRIFDQVTGAIDANYYKGYGTRTMITIPISTANTTKNGRSIKNDGDPTFTISTSCDNGVCIIEPEIKYHNKSVNQGRRVYDTDGISSSLGVGNAMSRPMINDKMKIRRLTPLECERLQGFPDGYTDELTDTQRYKCLGNAVTVPVVQYILEHLIS